MTLFSSATAAVTDTDSRTALTAHSLFRPRFSTMLSMKATVSFSTFLASSFPPSLSTSLPPIDTGCAAPMFVPGAIAATWPESVMKTPAEPAWAPSGET